MLKLLFTSMALASVLSFAAPKATLKLTKVLNLETMEVYDTHLVHAGRVWEGKLKIGKVETPCIDIFNLDGKLDGRVELTYTPTHIFPNGTNSVMVTGQRSGENFATPFTRITLQDGKYVSHTTELGEEIAIEHFVGDGKREIFAEFADRALLGNLKGPLAQVNTQEVIGPHHMILFDDSVYVLNNHAITGAGYETISKVDLATGKVKIVSGPNYRQGVNNLYYHKRSGLIAFPEFLIKQVTLFDPKTDTVVGSIPMEGPRALASFGNCIAVAAEEKRVISFFDLSTPEHTLVSTWDLSSVGSTFKIARNIGIDEASGKLFARSTYMCTNCPETMSSVVMAEEPSQETRKACFPQNP